jgi:hypothetical protein
VSLRGDNPIVAEAISVFTLLGNVSGRRRDKAAMTNIKAPTTTEIERFISIGYDLARRGWHAAASDVWLEAWSMLKLRLPESVRSIEDATLHLSARTILSFWIQDLGQTLGAAADLHESYAGRREHFLADFGRRLPSTSSAVFESLRGVADTTSRHAA